MKACKLVWKEKRHPVWSVRGKSFEKTWHACGYVVRRNGGMATLSKGGRIVGRFFTVAEARKAARARPFDGVRVNLHPHKRITTNIFEGDTYVRGHYRWAKVGRSSDGSWYVARGWKGEVTARASGGAPAVIHFGKRTPGGPRSAAMIWARSWVEDE